MKPRIAVFPQPLLPTLALSLLAWCGSSLAQTAMPHPPSASLAVNAGQGTASPTLQLEASASRQVPEDTAWALLSVEREAPDQATAQKQAQAALAELIAKARQTGPELELRTEGMYTMPVHAPKGGKITAWRSHMELHLQSTQAGLVAQVAAALLDKARLQGTGFFLSPAKRQAAERELIDEAVKAFEFKAQATARAMGFARTAYKDVVLQQPSGGVVPYGRMAMQAAPVLRAEDQPTEPLVMEPGKADVSVSLSGTVNLLR